MKRFHILIVAGLFLAILFVFHFGGTPKGPMRSEDVKNQQSSARTLSVDLPASSRSDTPKATVQPKTSDGPNVSIEFWGKVLDQDANPISGVRIRYKLRTWPLWRAMLFRESRFSDFETITDGDGRFAVTGLKGDSLSIEIEMAGYTAATTNRYGFAYGNPGDHVPDSQNPVVFRMIKTGIVKAERLVSFEFNTRIPYDGTPTTFDVVSQSKYEGLENHEGDIRITLERTPQKISLGSTGFDWHARIEVLKGGLVLVRDDLRSMWEQDLNLMFKAPVDGYVSAYEIRMQRSDPRWVATRAISLYFQSRNGQCFGRAVIQFDTGSERERTEFTMKGAMNPTSSRNLQSP